MLFGVKMSECIFFSLFPLLLKFKQKKDVDNKYVHV